MKFETVYEEAKNYLANRDISIPCNPVVRLEGERWAIESEYEEANSDCILEVDLESFQAYWYEGMMDSNYIPSEEDIDFFIGVYTC